MTRTRMVVIAGVWLLAAGIFVAAHVEQAAVRITKEPQGYLFTEGDTKVLFYQAERKALPDGQAARSNYFHPLYDHRALSFDQSAAGDAVGRASRPSRVGPQAS